MCSHVRLLTALVLLGSALPATATRLEDEVARVARLHLLDSAKAAGLTDPTVTLQVAPARRAPPVCDGTPRVEATDTRHPSRMRFAAICPGHDDERTEFVVRASLSAQVVVTTTAISAGRPINATEVTLERRSIGASDAPTADLDAVIGQSSRRALRSGQTVDTDSLSAPVLVRRGAAVRIVARNGQVLVTAAGEALAAGRNGDLIEVRNTATGKVIHARVTGRNEVAPADITPAPQSAR